MTFDICLLAAAVGGIHQHHVHLILPGIVQHVMRQGIVMINTGDIKSVQQQIGYAEHIFALRKELKLLDVITLGKEQAINLGVDYNRTIGRLLVGVTVCIAIATALVGPISFLGLIIANLGRQMMQTYRHSQLIAASTMMGSSCPCPGLGR